LHVGKWKSYSCNDPQTPVGQRLADEKVAADMERAALEARFNDVKADADAQLATQVSGRPPGNAASLCALK
jgi:hypothetical protein